MGVVDMIQVYGPIFQRSPPGIYYCFSSFGLCRGVGEPIRPSLSFRSWVENAGGRLVPVTIVLLDLSRAEHMGHRDGEVRGVSSNVGCAVGVEGRSKPLAPGVLRLHVPTRVSLGGHKGRDVAVGTGNEVAIFLTRRRAGGGEAGGVLGLNAADVEVVDTLLLSAGGSEVRHLPGQSWALIAAQRTGGGEAGGGERNGEDGSELHDGDVLIWYV